MDHFPGIFTTVVMSCMFHLALSFTPRTRAKVHSHSGHVGPYVGVLPQFRHECRRPEKHPPTNSWRLCVTSSSCLHSCCDWKALNTESVRRKVKSGLPLFCVFAVVSTAQASDNRRQEPSIYRWTKTTRQRLTSARPQVHLDALTDSCGPGLT